MRLSELAAGYIVTPAGGDPEISGLSEDSRRIRPGMVFVAVPGTSLDGHAYVTDAAARGAAAIVAERTGTVPPGMPSVRVPSARVALAELAARFYGNPAAQLRTIGFAGTFGKTSTSEILRLLLDAGGARTGVLGSLGARYGDYFDSGSGLTTPAPVELHKSLRQLRVAGADTAIMEVTSHALRLERIRGIRFDGGLLAAILPGEHTDFHRSYDDYVDAKRRFLDHLTTHAVLAYDSDNRAARRIAMGAQVATIVGYSTERRDADLVLSDVELDERGTTFTITGAASRAASGMRLHSALLGRGHLRNVGLSLAYALTAGLPVSTAATVLRSLVPLPRRMERYDIAGRTVLDDSAAHPDSFRGTLEVAALLPHRASTLVYAVRGSRGADINRRNAIALADLSAVHGVETLIVTAATDCTGAADQVSATEVDAARQALVERGRRFVWHDTLQGAIGDALDRSKPGDLLILAGAQGMNEGRRILTRFSPR
jgi:UDP-N-acetylmuramoyl-L-alanyl-D-glutamate--2,6-diaminopimelate ligase